MSNRIRHTDKLKPGGLDGSERINFESRQGDNSPLFNLFDCSLQDIANLATGFTPVDGNGTTVNGSAIDLGGAASDNIYIDVTDYVFEIRDFDSGSNYLSFNRNGSGTFSTYLENTSNSAILQTHRDVRLYAEEPNDGSNAELKVFSTNSSTTYASMYVYNANTDEELYFKVTSTGISMFGAKTGATQVAAGAAANELWITSSHATLPDGVIMIGL